MVHIDKIYIFALSKHQNRKTMNNQTQIQTKRNNGYRGQYTEDKVIEMIAYFESKIKHLEQTCREIREALGWQPKMTSDSMAEAKREILKWTEVAHLNPQCKHSIALLEAIQKYDDVIESLR